MPASSAWQATGKPANYLSMFIRNCKPFSGAASYI